MSQARQAQQAHRGLGVLGRPPNPRVQARCDQSAMLAAGLASFLRLEEAWPLLSSPVTRLLGSVHHAYLLPSFHPVPLGVSLHFQRLLFQSGVLFLLSRPGLSPLASIFTFSLVISFHCSVLPGGLGVYLTCIDSGLSQRLKTYSKRGTEVSSLPAGPSRGHAASANLRSPGRFPSHDSIQSSSVTS